MGGNRKLLNISKNGGLTTHTKRYLPLTHQLCEQAAIAAFEDKWFRRNYLADAQKYGGVAYGRLKAETAKNEMHAKLEAVHGIALEMEQRVLDLMDGTADDLDLDPVHTFYRIDGISMKVRELSDCCPMHQCFGHLAVLALQPLLRAKLLPYQFASIPEKGQVALKRQVERWLRRKSLRAADDLRKTGRIPLYRSYRLISYNGYFVGTKTSGAAAELEQRHLFKAAKWAVGAAARLREVKKAG